MNTQYKAVDSFHLEEYWSLLERAAASSQLKRAARLREFLFYVATKSLKEGYTDIHEQEIGHAVFGRDENYDTSQDNIVRVSATELRKRIEAYFKTEGANEPLVFDIPRGSYTPVFRLRIQEIQAPKTEALSETPSPELSVPASYRRLPLMLASAMAILLAIGCAVLWTANRSMHGQLYSFEDKPALADFWSRFLNSNQDTDIILADTSFALIEDITRQTLSLSDYLNHAYIPLVQSPDLSEDRKTDLNLIVARQNGSMGDFYVAQKIRSLDYGATRLFLKFAREYTTDSLRRDNVILIGSQKPNPWVDLFLSQMNFTIEYDPTLDQSFVKNLHPRPGEQSTYAAPTNPYSSTGYSIIAYLPNPSHTASALIIAGTDSQATNAAGDFVTSEESMESFLRRLHRKQIPYFEILLKTTRLSNTPFSAQIIAYRTY